MKSSSTGPDLHTASARRKLLLPAVLVVAVATGLLALLVWAGAPSPQPEPSAGHVLPGGALVVWSPSYRVHFFGLERLHPFDLTKYDTIADGLLERGLLTADDFAVAAPIDEEQLQSIHDPAYLAALHHPDTLSRALEVHLPRFVPSSVLERRVLKPFQAAVGGSVLAARGAREHGLGIHLGGGYHHARPDAGHGFCLYNDVAMAVHTLRADGLQGNILIIDTDAHQGDGNHAFFADDPTVFSWSMHQEDLFPIPKLKGDLDLPLRAGVDDDAFLWTLEQHLPGLLDRLEPVLVIHVAGADVLVDDPLAGLHLSPRGLVHRDLFVAQAVREAHRPLLHLLAGGYGPSAAMAQEASVAAMLELFAEPAP